MKITRKHFNGLSEAEKLDITFYQGTFLSGRQEKNYLIELYALFNFFVEVWYGGLHQGGNPFVIIRSFQSAKFLDPFLFEENSFSILKKINGPDA